MPVVVGDHVNKMRHRFQIRPELGQQRVALTQTDSVAMQQGDPWQSMSLLAQSLLYSSPDYHPFKASLVDQPQASTLFGSDQSAAAEPEKKPSKSAPERLLTTDFDFDKPLIKVPLFAQPVTPLKVSTDRRPKNSRSRKTIPTSVATHSDEQGGLGGGYDAKKSLSMSKSADPRPLIMSRSFLSVPREVRDLIYNFLFERARVYYKHKPYRRCSFDVNLAFRCSCRTIYEETSEPLFRFLSLIIEDCEHKQHSRELVTRSIPRCLLNNVRYLAIVRHEENELRPEYLPIAHLPSLENLKIVYVPRGRGHVVGCASMQFRLNRVMKKMSNFFNPTKTQELSWLASLISRSDRTFSIDCELEFWFIKNKRGASGMEHLKRLTYGTIVIAHGETAPSSGTYRTSTTELDMAQFRDRCEFYCAMDKRDGFGESVHASHVLSRLASMEYQLTLDKIESNMVAKGEAPVAPDVGRKDA